MKRLGVLLWAFLLLQIFVHGCSGGGGNEDPYAPLMGMLQFRIQHNLRDKLERCRIDEDLEVEVTAACPDVDPGTVIDFQYDPGTGPVMASFDLERSYRNFVLYLYAKLQPGYFAIKIEVNMFKAFCPGSIFHPNWPVRQP